MGQPAEELPCGATTSCIQLGLSPPWLALSTLPMDALGGPRMGSLSPLQEPQVEFLVPGFCLP